jgi:type I restriction enzyme S subunit
MQLEIMTPAARIAQYNTDDAGVILEGIETITTDFILEDSSSEKGNKKLKSKKQNKQDTHEKKDKSPEFEQMEQAATEANAHLMDISNRDTLRDKIHEIHNFLRNNGAGYGMNALKVFNLLYGLKRINQANDKYMKNNNNILEGQPNLYNKLELDEKICSFTEILKLVNDASSKVQGEEELFHILDTKVLDSINKSKIKSLLFYEIPKNIKAIVYVQLIQLINEVSKIEDKYKVQLSGNIYEYFIGRDETAISELGAYFTNRYIINFILDKLQPKLKADGTIPEMIDMFGGSGGFTTGYIDYLIKHNQTQKIDWASQLKKVHHYDMNEDVIKSAGLEMFLLTDEIPTSINNFNSFKSEFGNKKFELIITNPPYGGDKVKKTIRQENQDIIKEFIKEQLPLITDAQIKASLSIQLKQITDNEKEQKDIIESQRVSLNPKVCSKRTIKFARDNGELKATDKEAVSLLMLMDMIAENGTVAGVLKEGVFFDKTYKDIRRVLIENFNVREVISVPSDQFENTSTKTSIIIFDNLADKKTSTVKFSEIIVEKYENNKLDIVNGYARLLEKKGDIKGLITKEISTATRDEILANPICSLNGKDYNKKVMVPGDGFKLVKLSDITDIKMGSTPSTKNSDFWENGTIPWVAIADLNNCIIEDTGKKLTNKGAETMKNRKIPINSILLSFKLSIGKLGITSREMYCNEAIAFLNSKLKNIPQLYLYYILECLDLKQFGRGTIGSNGNLNKDILTNLQIPIPTTDQSIQQWVDKISKPFDEKNTKAKRIKELEEQVQTQIKEIIENEDCDEVELGSLCKIYSGKPIKKENRIGTLYPYCSANGIDGYVNEYLFDGTYILCAQDGSIGATHLMKGKIYPSNHVWLLDIKNTSTNFIYCILKHFTNYDNYRTGSVIPKITKDKLEKIKIQIPKDQSLITALEPTFQEIEKLQDEVKQAEALYKQYLDELGTAAIKKDSSAPPSTPEPTPPNQPLTLESTINTESKPSTPAKKAAKIIKRKSPTSNSSKSSGGGGVSLDDILG